MIVENRNQLLSHGHVPGRRLALDIIDRTLERIDAARLTRQRVRLEGSLLHVDGASYDLSRVRHIYVLGAGKGVLQIAEAIEAILGTRITGGLVVEKRLQGMPRAHERIARLRRVEVRQGGHPIPDQLGLEATREIVEIIRQAGPDDLLFCCVQGGCTSLTTLPAPGLSLEEVQQTTDILLKSGADIEAVNIVRTAVTCSRQGSLARHAGATQIINLAVIDAVWSYPRGREQDPRYAGWGPCVPVREAVRRRLELAVPTLQQFDAWEQVPSAVREHLLRLDPAEHAQTAADLQQRGVRWQNVVLAAPEDGAETALLAARELGLNATVLSAAMEGEAAEVGVVYAAVAKEITRSGRPLRPPCAVIVFGEMTVTLAGAPGEGGRNQECVLSAALKLEGSPNAVVVSVGTDGTDGPTEVAGGIVDGQTVGRARELGLDLTAHLKLHDATPALRGLGDAVYFNQPGNNLCDLSLIVVTG